MILVEAFKLIQDNHFDTCFRPIRLVIKPLLLCILFPNDKEQ